MNELYILYALTVTFFNPDAVQGERIVTQSLSYHATELLCDEAKDRWVKMTTALYPDREPNYILKCDPPTYYYFEPAGLGFGPVEIWQKPKAHRTLRKKNIVRRKRDRVRKTR